jgi:hypothetical protein
MQRILFTLLFLIFSNLSSFAQTPELLDQFPKISMEDLLSRLDYLGSELISKNSSALIRIYSGSEDLQGYPYRYAAIMKTHLTNRKIDDKKIFTQQCDGEKETRFETYLVSPDAKIPECEKSLIIPNNTLKFDSYFYSFEYPDFDDCCAIVGADRASAEASLKAFADLLKKSPESKAYIISYNGTNIH